MDLNDNRDLMGATAASRYLGISRTTLHRLVEAGELIPTQRTSSGYRRFSTHELRRFQILSGNATPVETSENEGLLGETLRRQSVLLDLAERICGPHSVESVCTAAVTVARDTLRSCERGSVWLVDEKNESLVPRANVGYSSNLDVSPFPIGGDSLTARALRTGQPIVCEDAILRPPEGSSTPRIHNADLRSFVASPIVGADSAHGLLLVGSRHPASLPAEDISFLTRLTRLLAQSLETALHLEQSEQVYETVQELSDCVVAGRTRAELASVAASTLGRISGADVVLISVRGGDAGGPGEWSAAWSPGGLRIEDLPPVPRDPALLEHLRCERVTFRIDNIDTYLELGEESRRIGTALGIPTWQVAPLHGPSGLGGSVSMGFRTRTQLSQSVLRSISVLTLHLGLAVGSMSRDQVP